MDERAIVSRAQEIATADALYGLKEDQDAMWKQIAKVAPWINPKHGPAMSQEEVVLVIRKAVAMGLDPLNPHEVQIWKDKRGQVNFQLGYPLVTQWVRHFKGEHTEPIYDRLTVPEMIEEGLDEEDVAYRVRFIMKQDLPHLKTLIDAGYEPKLARRMVEVKGIGVASAKEYDNDYFAPKGRSKAWKVKKRALTDAYRRKFGTPGRPEIMELRRLRGDAQLTLDDWRVASESARNGDARLQIARVAASNRSLKQEIEQMDPAERRAFFERHRTLLAGTEEDQMGPENVPSTDDDIVDGEIIDEFAEIKDQPDLYAAATFHTPGGKTLGKVKRKELSQMLDYLLSIENPKEETVELRGHVETCLEYLRDFPDAGNIDLLATIIDDWTPPEEDLSADEIVGEMRREGGWTLDEDGNWARGESDAPKKQAMQRAAAIIGSACGSDDDKRHDLLAVVYGESSTKALNATEVAAVTQRWQATPGAFDANQRGMVEAHKILHAHSLFKAFADTL